LEFTGRRLGHFRANNDNNPWSILYRVEQKDKTTALAKALGLSHPGAAAVLHLVGLLTAKATEKEGKFDVELRVDAWQEFLKEEQLQ
jgi:hypothetical protein